MPKFISHPSRLAVSVLSVLGLTASVGLPASTPAAAAAPASAAVSTPQTWDTTATPPPMVSPTLIELSSETPSRTLVSWGILCSGQYYRINLEPDEDAIITMGGSEPLAYPVWVMGGRNVQIIGLEMDMAVQPGCGAGELPNSGSSAMSIHPRLPGAMAVRLQNYGTAFIEGVDIDLAGHESDCFVFRNPAEMSNETASWERNVVIQNTSCTGIEGLGSSSIGDGVHGDLFQNQGDDVMNSLVIENVTVRSSMEGLVLHRSGQYSGARTMTIRRMDYAIDERYDNDDAFEQLGVAFDARADSWTLDQVFIADPRGNDYGFVNQQRYGAFATSVLIHHEGVRHGPPTGGAFAPEDQVGLGYRSPHGESPQFKTTTSSQTGTPDRVQPSDSPNTEPANQNVGAVHRLYQAAFGRSPEQAGALYWRGKMKAGLSLEQMAATFQLSDEWDLRYGKSPTNQAIVDALYLNVLGRSADGPGYRYWVGLLEEGQISHQMILVSFSESAENKTGTGTS